MYLEVLHESASWPTLLPAHSRVLRSKLSGHPLDKFAIDVGGSAFASSANDEFLEGELWGDCVDLVRGDVDCSAACRCAISRNAMKSKEDTYRNRRSRYCLRPQFAAQNRPWLCLTRSRWQLLLVRGRGKLERRDSN